MDGFGQIGKYLKKTQRNTELSLKREVVPQISSERIRDIFDSTHPVQATINTPDAMFRVMVDFNFGRKLPSLDCCADCYCGTTESYTSDSLVNGSIYVLGEYIPNSTFVYLDGAIATLGVEYTEANPTTGQLAINVPFTEIIVSYVYTVGNCTDAICIDNRFECLDYTFLAGLTTVFSDRYDRSAGLISGGCGQYVSSTGTSNLPLIANGEAAFGSNNWIRVGGPNNLVGQSVEMLMAINTDNMGSPPTGDANITFHNAGVGSDPYSTFFKFTKTTSTSLKLELTTTTRQYIVFDDPFSNINLTSFDYEAFSVDTTIAFTGGRYWFRMAQINGFAMMKAWPQFTPEPAGAQLVIQLADSYADVPIEPDEVYRDIPTPTVQEVGVDAGGVEALMIGAGLDNGAWGFNAGGIGVNGTYCAPFPSGEPAGWERFGFCDPSTNTATIAGGTTHPELFWSASWPTILGDVPPDGSGKLIQYEQSLASWTLTDGRPNGVRVKGQLVADVWDNTGSNSVAVQIKSFNTGPLTMAGSNGLTGGSIVATYTVPTNGTPVDVDFVIPSGGEEVIRWGLHVEGLDGYIAAQPAFEGSFLSPNNTGNIVQFYDLRAEGIQSVECTAGPFCDDCSSTRCPELVDNFDTYTTTAPFGTTDYVRIPTQGAPYTNDKGTGTQVTYSGGVQTVSFQGSTQKFLNVDYASPFDCNYPDEENGIYDAYFEVLIGTPTGIETGSFLFGNIDIDYTGGGGIFPGSFGVTPTFNSTAITPGTWWSVRNRIEGTDFLVRVWPAGTTEPSTWTFEGTITAFSVPYVLGSFSSNGSSPTFTTQTRAVHITRGV